MLRTIVAVLMGGFSGFLIHIIAVVVFSKGHPASPSFVLVTFFTGWIISSYVMLYRAKSLSGVFARGFLIGAVEWLAMIPVGFIFIGKAVSETISTSGPEGLEPGAMIEGGLFAFLTAGVSIFMAVVCLAGFAVSYFVGRQKKPEACALTRKCPVCAGLVETEATTCPCCSAALNNYPINP